ncbi:MAG: hypothetical protein QME48_00240 [bacterium]|nr:hypothetical protein [bacterium]
MRKIIRLKPIAFIESFKEVLQVKITKRAPKSKQDTLLFYH